MSRHRHLAYVVLSWSPRDPRATIRLDGYYFARAHAAGVEAHERETFGRHALLLAVLDPPPGTIPLPDDLFNWIATHRLDAIG